MSKTTLNSPGLAHRILHRMGNTKAERTKPIATKIGMIKARQALEKQVRIAGSPLNSRRIVQSNGSAHLAGKIHPLETANKAADIAQLKIKEFVEGAKNGLLPKAAAQVYGKSAEEAGTCPAVLRSEIDKTMELNNSILEANKRAFQKEIRTMSDPPARQEMKQKLKAVNNELKLEKNAWEASKQSFDYIDSAKEDFKLLVKLENKLQKKGKLSRKETENFSKILWTHKENIPILLNHLDKFQNAMSENKGVRRMVEAAMLNLANSQLALADLMSLHSSYLPDRPALSRQERMAYHLLQAQAVRGVVKNLKENYFPKDAALHKEFDAIDVKLAKHEKALIALKNDNLPPNIKGIRYLLEMPIMKEAKLSDALTRHHRERLGSSKSIPVAMKGMTQKQMLGLYLTGALNRVITNKNQMPDIGFLQTQAMVEKINQQKWTPINSEIKIQIDGKKANFQSQINPAAEHSARLSEPYSGNGVGAEDRLQYTHAINLAQTKLINEKGETLFAAHRSGVMDSYQITTKNLKKLSNSQLTKMLEDLVVRPGLRKAEAFDLVKAFNTDPKEAKVLTALMRKQASRVMAEETAATMILADPALLKKAERGEMVELPITSISLMTPDYLTALGSKAGEKEMLRNHKSALEELSNYGEAISIPIRTQSGDLIPVLVKVVPRVMSFGVNAGALRGVGVLSGNRLPFWRRLMGWGLSAKMNDPALNELLGAASAKVVSGAAGVKIAGLKRQQQILRDAIRTEKSNTNDQAKLTQMQEEINSIDKQISKTTQLAEQIQSIRNSKSFMRESRDPYKMPARLLLLVDAIGEKPLVHCKSGKDRTGQTDVEAKYLASVFDMTGKIPQPSLAPTKQSIMLRTKFAMKAGNHEMQQYNTGIRGFKLIGVPSLNAQFERFALPNYRGGSKFAKT